MSKMILSLDGGGIRGAATTQFLMHVEKELQEKYNKSIRDCVDFYAGTSTGSIIALALATTDLAMKDINELYNHENAKKIFKENKGLFEWDGINAPKYQAKGKRKMLKEKLVNKDGSEPKIADVPKDKHILAVTYGIERRRPEVIKSTKEKYRELLSYQVADSSSAAPTYFPTKELGIPPDLDQFWLVDGGIIANNPTMCAISEAIRTWKDKTLQDLRVLSVGTGYRTRKINGPDSKHWGAVQWAIKGHLIDLLQDEKVVDYQAITITTPGKYIRVNAELRTQPGLAKAPDDAMDDISETNIKRLRTFGDFLFNQYGEYVIQLLMDNYKGHSLDSIDPKTGKPEEKTFG